MASLVVEIRDINFVLYEQFKIEELVKKERFDHCSRDDFDMILEHALKLTFFISIPSQIFRHLAQIRGYFASDAFKIRFERNFP